MTFAVYRSKSVTVKKSFNTFKRKWGISELFKSYVMCSVITCFQVHRMVWTKENRTHFVKDELEALHKGILKPTRLSVCYFFLLLA